MGGLALKHLNVQRVSSERYFPLAKEVTLKFQAVFGHRPTLIPAYVTKPDFGDCDMLITPNLPSEWREEFGSYVSSKGWVRNGDVTSMEISGVQFDFITVPHWESEFAYTYFAFNDLGNLMGRVAHKMGFKYGHSGLYYPLTIGTNRVEDILMSRDVAQVFTFLGYDHTRWLSGFNTLEDVFKFAASSKYFSPDIYLLHNRNAKARMRDAKRKSYTEFLRWCEVTPDLGNYMWTSDPDSKAFTKSLFLAHAIVAWPDFGNRVTSSYNSFQDKLDLKSR